MQYGTDERDAWTIVPSEPWTYLGHASWFDDEVYDVLATHGIVLGASDEERPDPPLLPTGRFGYLRLRDEQYDEATQTAWLERLEAVWPATYVFFKHEESAPASIAKLDALARSRAKPTAAVDPPG